MAKSQEGIKREVTAGNYLLSMVARKGAQEGLEW